MELCAVRNRFMFEVRPDIFPEGWLTDTESELWARYYDEQERNRKQRAKRG
jgi:hypothetical protein